MHYITRDEYFRKWTRVSRWMTGSKRLGTGATSWHRTITSVEEKIGHFLSLSISEIETSMVKEGLVRLYKGPQD
jgi:hypothetical protein